MSGSFTAIDLSSLPAPDIVETLSFEQILAEMVADLQSRDPAFSALVESDPAYKILEVAAFRETLVRQRANDSARAVMLAYAGGTDLDQIGANYNVARLLLDPGDPAAVPPVPPTYESDTDFRRRIQLAFEGLSTAGPTGAYIFHAIGADPDVLDVSAISPNPGEVLISVLSRTGSGTASAPLLAAVTAALSAEDVRPLTDQVTVQSAAIVNYSITATIYTYPGPDSAVVIASAQAAVEKMAADLHRMGKDVARSAVYAALHQPGVSKVVLSSPAADITISDTQASYCTAINLTNGGTNV